MQSIMSTTIWGVSFSLILFRQGDDVIHTVFKRKRLDGEEREVVLRERCQSFPAGAFHVPLPWPFVTKVRAVPFEDPSTAQSTRKGGASGVSPMLPASARLAMATLGIRECRSQWPKETRLRPSGRGYPCEGQRSTESNGSPVLLARNRESSQHPNIDVGKPE